MTDPTPAEALAAPRSSRPRGPSAWVRVLGASLAAASLMFLLASPGVAMAKKGKKDQGNGIWVVGFESVDSFFADVDKLDRDLDAANRLLDAARGDLNSALGLNKRTTMPKALEQLNRRANGKLTMVKKGKKPQLAATDAVPSDVQLGIDAINGFTGKLGKSIERLATAPKTAQSLVKKSKTLPDQVRSEVEGDLFKSIFKGPKALKAVNHNVGVTRKLPKKADRTVGRMNRINKSITQEFAGGSKLGMGSPKKRGKGRK